MAMVEQTYEPNRMSKKANWAFTCALLGGFFSLTYTHTIKVNGIMTECTHIDYTTPFFAGLAVLLGLIGGIEGVRKQSKPNIVICFPAALFGCYLLATGSGFSGVPCI